MLFNVNIKPIAQSGEADKIITDVGKNDLASDKSSMQKCVMALLAWLLVFGIIISTTLFL